MVGLEILVKIKPEKRAEFLQTFDLMSRAERRAPECTHQAIFEKLGEPNKFLWTEEWKTGDSLVSYQQSDRFRSLLGAIDVLGNLVNIRSVTLKEGYAVGSTKMKG